MLPRPVLFASAALAFAACTSTESTTSPESVAANASVVLPTDQPTASVRCELRLAGPVSRISVRGTGLAPANGFFRGVVRSGGVSIGTLVRQIAGTQAEFDFSSDPADIARGARAIPANFITIDPNGPDVIGAIVDPNGNRVAINRTDCQVR